MKRVIVGVFAQGSEAFSAVADVGIVFQDVLIEFMTLRSGQRGRLTGERGEKHARGEFKVIIVRKAEDCLTEKETVLGVDVPQTLDHGDITVGYE